MSQTSWSVLLPMDQNPMTRYTFHFRLVIIQVSLEGSSKHADTHLAYMAIRNAW